MADPTPKRPSYTPCLEPVLGWWVNQKQVFESVYALTVGHTHINTVDSDGEVLDGLHVLYTLFSLENSQKMDP